MRLQRLRLTRMPGVDDAIELRDLTGGLNVVVGPNGSGKSSMCRAIRAMLWGAGRGERVECEGTWLGRDGVRLDAELDGRQTTWRESGRIVSGPVLPDASLSGCYVISVEDLVTMEGEADLAGRVLREMMAGVYPGGVRLSLFTTGVRAGHAERRQLQQARTRLAQAEAEAAGLDDSVARLPELERRRDEARQARVRLSSLERRRELLDVQAREAAARARIDAMPVEAGRIRGDELERLEALQQQREEAAARLVRLEDELATAVQAVAAGQQHLEAVSEEELEACRARVAELQRLLSERDRVQRSVLPLETRRARLAARVGPGDLARDGVTDSTAADFETALRAREGFLREVEALEAEVRA
ncbi:MAG: AAA family ATPase, partial [Phycisphaerales bacterium]|nr:AAA family ATPase [Phycisphaerales bacterium]